MVLLEIHSSVYCNQSASDYSSPFPQPYIILISTESTEGREKKKKGGAEDLTVSRDKSPHSESEVAQIVPRTVRTRSGFPDLTGHKCQRRSQSVPSWEVPMPRCQRQKCQTSPDPEQNQHGRARICRSNNLK